MLLTAVTRSLRRLRYGGSDHYCPVCDSSLGRFHPGGVVLRADASCPVCGSLERHRLVWEFLRRRTDLFDGRRRRMLHVAPERCLENQFARVDGLEYLTADLLDPRAMERIDITSIPHDDGAFDVIFCSHVLEHVPDDRQAMRELRRTLAPDGWALMQVPVSVEETVEDPTLEDPAERLRLFGQDDHVRRYGRDFIDRLREAGFRVEHVRAGELCDAAEVERLGLKDEDLYFCT